MSQQYGVPVGSMPGAAGPVHTGTGPYPGPNMQFHPGETGGQR